jgi:hypothetical protein
LQTHREHVICRYAEVPQQDNMWRLHRGFERLQAVCGFAEKVEKNKEFP